MCKYLLAHYAFIKREHDYEKRQLEMGNVPYSPKVKPVDEHEYRQCIRNHCERLSEQLREMDELIEGCPDSVTRDIMNKRFRQGKQWSESVVAVYYVDSARKSVARYIKKHYQESVSFYPQKAMCEKFANQPNDVVEFLQYANRITDSNIRFVVKLRYIGMMQWADIDAIVYNSVITKENKRNRDISRKLLEKTFKKHE